MRNISLLLVALLAVSGMAFAQVVIEPKIEVEASATFGVQLDEMTTGIKNKAEATLSFTFTEEQTSEFGEGEVYGWVELEDFKVEFESKGDDKTDKGAFDVSVGKVKGMAHFGPAYISVDEAVVKANEAEAFALIDERLVAYTEYTAENGTKIGANIGKDYKPEYPGVAFGFEVPDVATIELGFASMYDWAKGSDSDVKYGDAYTEDQWKVLRAMDPDKFKDEYKDVKNKVITPGAKSGVNGNNAYVVSIDAEITAVENITIALVSTMEFGVPYMNKDNEQKAGTPGTKGNPIGGGLSVEYSLPLGETTLIPVIGFDVAAEQDYDDEMELRMEAGLGVKLKWADLGLDEDDDDHIDFIGDAADDNNEEVTSGAYFGAVYGMHSADILAGKDVVVEKNKTINTMDVRFGVYEDDGDDGLFPVVGGAAMVEYTTILKNEDAGIPETRADLGMGIEINTDLGMVTPYAGFKYIMKDVNGKYLDLDKDGETEADTFAAMNIGIDINVVSNTTFTVDYASGDLLWNKDEAGMDEATYGSTFGNITSSNAKLGVVTLETKIEF